MVFNQLSVSTKRTIIGVTSGVLGAAQMPGIGPWLNSILTKQIVGPVSVGIIVGAIALVGAYMVLSREGV